MAVVTCTALASLSHATAVAQTGASSPAVTETATTDAASRAEAVLEGTAEERIAEGLALYESGKYSEAARLFLSAHRDVPDSNLLYNAARCYERLGADRKAIVLYQQYIQAADSDAQGRLRANAALQRLEQAEFLAIRKGLSDHYDEPSPGAADSEPIAASGGLYAPWCLLGLGSAALGVGAWSLFTAFEMRREVLADPAISDHTRVYPATYTKIASKLESSQRRMEWGAVASGLGSALVVTSAVWWALQRDAAPEKPRVELSFGADRVGTVSMSGNF